MDKVFRALADDTRRRLLDRLHENNGQTLGELCERIAMTRRSVTQHLAVLIDEFERPRLAGAVKRRAEEAMTGMAGFAYVTYIASTPEKVGGAHRRRPDRRLLGPQQRLRLAARVPLGARAHRRLRRRRRGRPGRGERAADPTGDDLGRARPGGAGGGALPGHLRDPAAHRPADRRPPGPRRRGRARGRRLRPAVLSDLRSLPETGRTLPREPWLVPSPLSGRGHAQAGPPGRTGLAVSSLPSSISSVTAWGCSSSPYRRISVRGRGPGLR
ncbi:Helix-turn-helix domain protein [Streptomyces reticuli]|nr:Helix-turn-helix domain protein [Streptomyces reticuli]